MGLCKMPKKIMVIDDEPDISTYIRAVLEDHGFATCTADGGDIVEQAVIKYKPDLIILDIMMPKRSGISIYKELRTTPEFKEIPIALISGMTPTKEFEETGFRAMIKDDSIPPPEAFIEKPINISILMRFINNLLQ